MRHAPLALAAVLAASCGPGDPTNPKVLWLATDMVETEVKLVDTEPNPF